MPSVRNDAGENLSSHGAYILSPAKGERQATLIASGSEVELALKAQEMLAADGIAAAVVSIPCWELFAAQSQGYRDEVLGPDSLRIAIEAALPFGWERWIGSDGGFGGMEGCGASAPAGDLFAHFKITPEAVVEKVKTRL